MSRDRFLPLAALLAYGIAFAAAALGGSLLVFDDHPGQFYRLSHVVRHGPAPWAWNAGWWTGYPELQFYPPGSAYAGALLHAASLGWLPVADAYRVLLWVVYLAPGLTTFVLLTRVLGDGWLALPGAFVALTFSLRTASLLVASGVEGGVHIGMVGARLAWALLPLVFLALLRWIEEGGAAPWRAVPLVAAVVLTHPALLPAAVALVVLAALARPPVRSRLRGAGALLAIAAALTGFWTVPLLFRVEHTRALGWGQLTLSGLLDAFARHPLIPALLALAVLVVFGRRDPAVVGAAAERLASRWFLVLIALVALDHVVLEPLGFRWLPADRVADGAWLALIVAAGLGWRRVAAHGPRRALLSGGAVALITLLSLPGATLALWPRAAEWPTLEETARGLRLPNLWATLGRAPEGRVLFIRSGVPLVHGTAWHRPHTHITALTPLLAGREIVNGTFTHPSPVAALVYRGPADRGAITRLVEQLDGESLFGRPLDTLDGATFNAYTDRLGVSVVVVLDEDVPRARALEDNPVFPRRVESAPFVAYTRATGIGLPREVAPGRWQLAVSAGAGGWVSARVAYYPLWRAEAGGRALAVRRGTFGELEVQAGGARTIELVYAPAIPEALGLVVTAVGVLGWAALAQGRRQSGPIV